MFLRLGLFLEQGVGSAVMWNASPYCTFPSLVSRNNQRSGARNGTANCELLALWVAQISHSGADWFHLKSGFLYWNSVRRKAISWIHPATDVSSVAGFLYCGWKNRVCLKILDTSSFVRIHYLFVYIYVMMY